MKYSILETYKICGDRIFILYFCQEKGMKYTFDGPSMKATNLMLSVGIGKSPKKQQYYLHACSTYVDKKL
jgi:hypothetical protein